MGAFQNVQLLGSRSTTDVSGGTIIVNRGVDSAEKKSPKPVSFRLIDFSTLKAMKRCDQPHSNAELKVLTAVLTWCKMARGGWLDGPCTAANMTSASVKWIYHP